MVKKHADVDKHYEHRDPRSSKSPEKNMKKTSISLKPRKSSQRQTTCGEKKKRYSGSRRPCGSAGEDCLQRGSPGLDPGVGKSPWRSERPTPVFWPGEVHGPPWTGLYIYNHIKRSIYPQPVRRQRRGGWNGQGGHRPVRGGGFGPGGGAYTQKLDCKVVRVAYDVRNQCCLSKIHVKRGKTAKRCFRMLPI
jgi:hypothetical protein